MRIAPPARLLATLLAAAAAVSTLALPAGPAEAQARSRQGAVIPGAFVVEVEPGQDPALLAQEYRSRGATISDVYNDGLTGFAATMPPAVHARLSADPRVATVEADMVVTASGVQAQAPWGLDRIDQRYLPLSGSYEYRTSGRGVTVYVVDTGVRSTHQQFSGRVVRGYDAFGGTSEDCHGHGTHVAGTVGGSTYGVAKDVRLVAVRVLDCGGAGTTSGVAAGIDWIIGNHPGGPAVVNLSLGGGASTVLDGAVRRGVGSGLTFVAAAGNSGADACRFSPARVVESITVGATTATDAAASWSNYGSCVDLYAPGAAIASATAASDTAAATMSGTSMAAPHAAGVAALYLEANPAARPADVAAALTRNATQVGGGRSRTAGPVLLYSLLTAATMQPAPTTPPPAAPVTNRAPVAGISASCSGLQCTFADASSDPDGRIVAWQWSLGDGTTASTRTASHGYGSAGSYTVRLTVTDDRGAQSSAFTTVSPTANTSGRRQRR